MVEPPKDYAKKKQVTILRLEKWARRHNVDLVGIPEMEGIRTPDYRAFFRDVNITCIIEVKEIAVGFDVSLEHGGVIHILEEGEPGGKFKSADKVRQKIRKAGPQLKPYAKKGFPTLLLIGMWNPLLDERLIMDIPVAMNGGGPRIIVGDTGFQIVSVAQGGRHAAGDINQSISGVGRFENYRERHVKSEQDEEMIVYCHNNPFVTFPNNLPGIRFHPSEAVFLTH